MGLKFFAFTLSILAHSAQAQGQVCDLTFTACPSQLPAGPIAVPLDVISLDVRIPYCQESGKIKSTASPSIMFIIDHSGSMEDTDPDHARYTVVNALLDSIYATTPSARVGLSIFNHRLAFDYRDNPFFKALFPGDNGQHDSYVPLTALDTTFGDGGRRGLDTLKALLRIDAKGELVHQTPRPKERTPPLGGGDGPRAGTDITLGFDAALDAFRNSKSPKEAQFIIFLSDGEPYVSDDLRRARRDAYEAGANTPTTYTVYFDPDSDTPPRTITAMTGNIAANGYSTSNPNSAVYTINLPGSELQSILQRSVLANILTVPATGKSVSVGIAGGPSQSTTTKPDSGHFLLQSRMPLNAGLTQITMKYIHSFKDTTFVPPLLRDTTFIYNLSVQRSAGAVLPANITRSCRDQAALALYSEGKSITSVTAGQVNLEARLTPAVGQGCANCTVKVQPSGGADRETVPLTPLGTAFSGPFTRGESLAPVPGDGKLQHGALDSIVLIWVNPENPLDMVRRSFPYQMIPSTLALFADGKPIDTVTADHSLLEVRLSRPSGTTCFNCTVQASLSGSADRETVPLALLGSTFNGSFIRLESIAPVAKDGKLQHLATDVIVLVWTNPDNPEDKVRLTVPYRPIAAALALFAGGRQLDTVTSAHPNLEIRLTLPSGEPCIGCLVQVFLSGGSDKEDVAMAGGGSPFRGTFAREVSLLPVPGDGKLQHLPNDSIILVYQNPLNPSQRVRRSYLFVNFSNIVGLLPHNEVAHTTPAQGLLDGRQWVISDAPNLTVKLPSGGSACCRVLSLPVNAQNPDSIHMVGIIVEASREFNLDLWVFSNLGQFVNQVAFTVTRSEFLKLSKVPGKDTRFLRLLWNGQAKDGTRAGTGAYIIKTAITLLPVPGITDAPAPTTSTRMVGVLRVPG